MNPLFNKPEFTVSIKSFGTMYLAHVNGVAIHREYDDDGQMSTTFPVNHLMRSGVNTLILEILPPLQGAEINPHAYIKMELLVKSHDREENTISITTIDFEGSLGKDNYVNRSTQSGYIDSKTGKHIKADGDITIHDIHATPILEYTGAIRFERDLDIPSSLPAWSFFSSDDIPNLDSMSDTEYYQFMDTLLSEYIKIQNALESDNIDDILPMFAERNKELDQAFYYPAGTMETKIRSSLSSAASDPNLELIELKRDYVDFTVEDNHKLVSLTRTGNKGAIVFNFKDTRGSQYYNFIFRRKDGAWILTR